VRQLRDAFRSAGLALGELAGSRFRRVRRIRELLDAGALDARLSLQATGLGDPGPGGRGHTR
jgi:hypothetical protein